MATVRKGQTLAQAAARGESLEWETSDSGEAMMAKIITKISILSEAPVEFDDPDGPREAFLKLLGAVATAHLLEHAEAASEQLRNGPLTHKGGRPWNSRNCSSS